MSSFKKIIASIIALTMVFSLAVPFGVFAETDADVTVGSVEVAPRGEAVVPISVSGASIGAFKFKISFDKDKLEFVKCSVSEQFSEIIAENNAIFAVNDNDAANGNIILGGAIANGAEFTAAPLNLYFKAADLAETATANIGITVERLRTADDEDQPYKATNGSVQITVKHITDVTFDVENVTINEGETFTPVLTVAPEDYTDVFAPVWASENEEIASVNENGVITANRAGETNITVTVGSIVKSLPVEVLSGVSAEITVGSVDAAPRAEAIVPISVSGASVGAFQFQITFDKDKLEFVSCALSEEFATLINDGEAIFLVNPDDAAKGILVLGCAITNGAEFTTAPLNLTFKAADLDESAAADIAITVERIRTAENKKIGYTTTDGKVQINVKHITDVAFNVENISINEGETFTPELIVSPDGYTDELAPVWASENTDVATVDENGVITAVKSGTTNITVTVGGISKSIPVEVKVPYMKGDFDNDKQITVTDALTALRIAAKLAPETEKDILIGDTDNDGHVTVTDALAILRVAAKLADTL